MNENSVPVDLSRSTMRSQLLWASLFPLVFFVLLSTLVTSSALNQMMLNLVIQRNTAQVQVLADLLAEGSVEHVPASNDLNSAMQALAPVAGSHLYLVDAQGNLISGSDGLTELPFDIGRVVLNEEPFSQLIESAVTRDTAVVSLARLPGEKKWVIFEEPWAAIMLPAFYYQLILVGLLSLGTALSLVMLSLAIGRVVRPIAVLAENAAGAVPGSIFHPVPEHGPLEIRSLINVFNQMVIRLAEQQTVQRQYAHKALLSQEEERQRLSHELHDGTLQDLVGLTQRVELCRNELDRDPQLARRRLDELHGLLVQTLGDVRRISNALRPPVLEDLGLSVALDALCQDLAQDKPLLKCEYIVSGEERRLQPDLELAVYRVVQEALTNVRKHAQDARFVQVDLVFGRDGIQTRIKNDGAVFADQGVRSFVRSGHIGLAGMYERASLFGGTLNVSSDSNQDTVVTLQLPC